MNSGAPHSCEGPKPYPFFRKHPSGGFIWHGCPRAAVTPHVLELLGAFDRCEGRMTLSEQRTAPGPLLDAFQTIDFAQAVRRWDDAESAKAQWKRKG